MNRFTAAWVGGVVLALQAAGCSGDVGGGFVSQTPVNAGDALSGATVTDVYFGVANEVPLGASPSVAQIHLLTGATVQLEAATGDSSILEFNVYRVREDGSLEMVSPVYAPDGFELETIQADSSGLFLFVFPAHAPTQVMIHLDCEVGPTCTNAGEPGETCAATSDCDSGLACARAIGNCSPLTGPAVCVVTGPACSLQKVPVCGCDGRTYATECAARLAGVGVASVGVCASDEVGPQ